MALFWRHREHAPPPVDPDLAQFHRAIAAAENGPPIDVDDPGRYTAADFAGIVLWMRDAIERANLDGVWERRLQFGYQVGESDMERSDFFWFNALPAIAALRSGHRDHPAVSMCAGLAESVLDRGDPAEVTAAREINERYFG
jgi:hypothetical protein